MRYFIIAIVSSILVGVSAWVIGEATNNVGIMFLTLFINLALLVCGAILHKEI